MYYNNIIFWKKQTIGNQCLFIQRNINPLWVMTLLPTLCRKQGSTKMLVNPSFLTFLFIHGLLLLQLLVVMSQSSYMATATAAPQGFSGLPMGEFKVVSTRPYRRPAPPSPKSNVPFHFLPRPEWSPPPPQPKPNVPIHFLPPPEQCPLLPPPPPSPRPYILRP